MVGWYEKRISRAALAAVRNNNNNANCQPPDAVWYRAVPGTVGPMPSPKRKKKNKKMGKETKSTGISRQKNIGGAVKS